jgi:hypothetical protein
MSAIAMLAKTSVRRMLRAVGPELEARAVDYYTLRQAPRESAVFRWRPVQRCPEARMDAGGAVVGHHLYVFGGFAAIYHVLSTIDVLDMRTARWVARHQAPTAMAHSHLAVASDGIRHIYIVSGQLGAHCHPATPRAFVFDTAAETWRDLPPLPEARYAATAQVWGGRLHVVGGSRSDRFTPATEHWSLAVSDERAADGGWRTEPPIAVGGPHRGSAVVDGRFYVFGGQQGDYQAIPGHPDWECSKPVAADAYHGEVLALDPGESSWHRVASMPVPLSHTESSTLVRGPLVYLFGGQCAMPDGDPTPAASGVVQCYDTRRDRWQVVGTLPYRVKTPVVGGYGPWIFAATGMRDEGVTDPRARFIVSQTWRGRLP